MHGKNVMSSLKVMIRVIVIAMAGAVLAAGQAVCAATDKTLVSWVALANTTQQGGSALTIQRGPEFDAIVFGEKAGGKWMAGSDFFKRTQSNPQTNAIEKAGPAELLQMAVVYRGNQVAIYRNSELYAAYETRNIDLLNHSDNQAVFGLRHEGAGTGRPLEGAIEDARIYDRALTAEEIRALKPNQPSGIKPYAWWTFAQDEESDRTGRFPFNSLAGGAKIENGRLVLKEDGEMIASRRAMLAGDATPAMPEPPPEDWPTFHLLHPGPGGASPGDPNCAFDWKGRYHLHYIYNHRAGFAFAHISSTNLVHWQWHPTTLQPKTTKHGMFSGTGFITKEGRPAIIYHGQGSGRNQLAFALDDNLEQWTKPTPIIPTDAAGLEPKFNNWDPDCWIIGDTYYALSGGPNPSLMKSADLKDWRFLGPMLHNEYPAGLGVPKGEDISCANMFKIGGEWMLLCISHSLGCRYYLGDFKDEQFRPRFHALMSWNGNHFFAPESVLTHDGRRVMWAWLLNLPVAPCGIQSLPRELELPADGILRMRPLRELQTLRYNEKQAHDVTLPSGAKHRLQPASGDALELELTFRSPAAAEYGVEVLCDKNGEHGLRVAVVSTTGVLRVGSVNAPFTLNPGEDLHLRVFVDKNLVEVFANDRQAAVAARKYARDNTGVTLFSEGGESVVQKAHSWNLKSIYTKP